MKETEDYIIKEMSPSGFYIERKHDGEPISRFETMDEAEQALRETNPHRLDSLGRGTMHRAFAAMDSSNVKIDESNSITFWEILVFSLGGETKLDEWLSDMPDYEIIVQALVDNKLISIRH